MSTESSVVFPAFSLPSKSRLLSNKTYLGIGLIRIYAIFLFGIGVRIPSIFYNACVNLRSIN
jgi:hypothetical protein